MGQDIGEGSNLFMNVHHESIGGPAAGFLDGDAVSPIQFEGHGASGTKGMAGDIIRSVAVSGHAEVDNGTFDCTTDVVGADLFAAFGHKVGADADVLCGAVVHDVGYSSSQGFDGGGAGSSAGHGDALASLPILLVVDDHGGIAGLVQFRQRGCVGNDGVVGSSKDDVLHFEPRGLAALGCRTVGVLSNSE